MVSSLCQKLGCLFRTVTGTSNDCLGREFTEGTWFYAYEPENPIGRVAILDLNAVNLAWFIQQIRTNLPEVAAYAALHKPADPETVFASVDAFVTEVVLPHERATKWLTRYKRFFGKDGAALIFTSMVPEKEFVTVARLDGWKRHEYCHYLRKPWNTDELIGIISSCLEHRGSLS